MDFFFSLARTGRHMQMRRLIRIKFEYSATGRPRTQPLCVARDVEPLFFLFFSFFCFFCLFFFGKRFLRTSLERGRSSDWISFNYIRKNDRALIISFFLSVCVSFFLIGWSKGTCKVNCNRFFSAKFKVGMRKTFLY